MRFGTPLDARHRRGMRGHRRDHGRPLRCVETASVVLSAGLRRCCSVAGRLAMRNLSRQKRRVTSNTAAALCPWAWAIVSCLGAVASSVERIRGRH